MATTSSRTDAPARRRPKLTVEELERRAPGLFEYLKGRYGVTKADVEKLRLPRHLSPPPSTAERAAGVSFDVKKVDRFLRFCGKLRHIKGRLAGQPFYPDLWQIVFIIAPVFGWQRADGTRRCRTLFLEVPRKNGKSTLCAAIALYLLTADGEAGAEVYSVGRDTDQARMVFDVAANMAKRSPALRSRTTSLIPSRVIKYPAKLGEYKALSSDRGGLAKHGLNVHGAIVDELHVITDAALIETVETGTGSRDQPLIVYITTAGIPEESPVWHEKRTHAEKVAAGELESAELHVVIYAADPAAERDGSWAKPETWGDANPGLGHSVRPDYLATAAGEAKVLPTKLASFLRLHLNIPTGARTGWMPLPTWDRSASIVDEADLRGARCFAGLDLSSSLDLSALALVFPDDAGEVLDVVMRFWTPAETLARRAHADQADYERWVKDGFLTTTPGETIDYDFIEAELVAVFDTFDLESVDYDPWGSKQLSSHLENAGLPIFACRQGYGTFSPAMKEAEKLIVERRLRHGGNPVLRYCVSNTVAVMDPAGNIKPDRNRSRRRIDGTVALLEAVNGWLRSLDGGESAYNDHELEVAG